MRRITLAVAASVLWLGATGIVSAQDLLRQMYSRVPNTTWTGFYVGGNAGYGWTKIGSSAVSALGSAQSSFTMKGAIAGGQIGTNIQSDKFVFGIEGDFQGSWQKIDGTGNATDLFRAVGSTAAIPDQTTSMDWFTTIRFRGGVGVDRVLIYGTGGVAAASIRTAAASSNFTLVKEAHLRYGWTAGGGVEVMVSPNVSVKGEYLHMDFGSYTNNYIYSVGSLPVDQRQRVTSEIVRVGVNFLFR